MQKTSFGRSVPTPALALLFPLLVIAVYERTLFFLSVRLSSSRARVCLLPLCLCISLSLIPCLPPSISSECQASRWQSAAFVSVDDAFSHSCTQPQSTLSVSPTTPRTPAPCRFTVSSLSTTLVFTPSNDHRGFIV